MNRFRALLSEGFAPVPGIYDALSARLIEQLGFRALYLPGNALGLHLAAGQPFVTLTETADAVRRISIASGLPLLVDAGAGFGAPAHVHRAVRELEHSGAEAIHIDDQPYPKRAAYHLGNGGVCEMEEAAAKLTAAVQARRRDTAIVARTDVYKVTGSIEQAAERARRYAATGIDALMVLNLSIDQVPAIRAAVPELPLLWFAPPSDDPPSASALATAGFAMGLYPFDTIGAVIEAVRHTWTSFDDRGTPARLQQSPRTTAKFAQHVIGMDEYWRVEGLVADSPPQQ